MPRLVGVLASAVAGACWLGALFLPWTSRGTLSTASLLDAVELVRRGLVDSIVPSGAAVLLLVPALAGTVLVGLVGFTGRAATALRSVALVLGSVAAAVLAWRLVDGDLGRLGAGAWLAVAGIAAAAAAAGVALGNRPRTRNRTPQSH